MAITSLRLLVCFLLCIHSLACRAVVQGAAFCNDTCNCPDRWKELYPAKGVAWDCLGQKMKVPFSQAYGCFEIRTGQFSCKDAQQTPADVGWFSGGLLGVLVLVHAILLVLPIIGTYLVWRTRDDLQSAGCSDVGLILVSMSLFALASFAEIAQHVMDNWILLGLIPTVYNAVFYGGLSLAQLVLALGAKNQSGGAVRFRGRTWADFGIMLQQLGTILSLATFVSLVAGWSACSAGPAQAPQWAGCYDFSIVWFVTFLALAVTAVCFFITTHSKFTWLPAAALYIMGLIGVISAIKTGHQTLHAVGALGFTGGFVFQLIYLLQLKAPETAFVHATHID